jgi:large repetitive protein
MASRTAPRILTLGVIGALALTSCGGPMPSTAPTSRPSSHGATAYPSPSATPSATATPVALAPAFVATGEMGSARTDHTATLLRDGRVLIAGGIESYWRDDGAYLDTAEIYDPAAGTFATTGSMAIARAGHSATLLADGRVLIAGGVGSVVIGSPTGGPPGWPSVRSAEIYDPATGRFGPTGSMMADRAGQTATLLSNGEVLMIGGNEGGLHAELYNPKSGKFGSALAIPGIADAVSATSLADGSVLLTGNGGSLGNGPWAEVYWPGIGKSVPAHSPAALPDTAVPLANGRVLLTEDNYTVAGASAELYDPATHTFSSTQLVPLDAAAAPLPDGRVLFVGGHNVSDDPVATAGLFDPKTGRYESVGLMSLAREGHTVTTLRDGSVLITGGVSDQHAMDLADLFELNPASGSHPNPHGRFVAIPAGQLPLGPTSVRMAGGRVLLTGGRDPSSNAPVAGAYVFDPTTGLFSQIGRMTVARSGHAAILLRDGRVLIASGTEAAPSAEIFDPATGKFTAAGGTQLPAENTTATLLPDGSVLFIGGDNGCVSNVCAAMATTEIYDPSSGTFRAAGSLHYARTGHAATLLTDGRVLVTGGSDPKGRMISRSEIYDPATALFAIGPSMKTGRSGHVALALASGRVLVSGGDNLDFNFVPYPPSTSEVYDPTTGRFAATGSMTQYRQGAFAVSLMDGRVLVIGGDPGGQASYGETYDPATGMFTRSGSLNPGDIATGATVLEDGRVLVVGYFEAVGPAPADPFCALYQP